jgi:ankyrin repeat protein
MKHTTRVHKHIYFLIVGLLLIGTTACSKCKKGDEKSITSIDDSMVDAAACLQGSGQQFMVELLTKLKKGEEIDVNTANTDDDDGTPLHYAAYIGYGPLMDALIEREAKVNATCKSDDSTPLHIAARFRHANCVEKLLKSPDINVNAEKKDASDGNTPLYYAIFNRDVKIVQLLLAHPNIDVNKKIKSIGSSTVLKMAESEKAIATDVIEKSKLDSIITALKAKGAIT